MKTARVAHPVADAQQVEGAERVGRELDPGAELGEPVTAFEHGHAIAFSGDRERGRQAADPAAGDQCVRHVRPFAVTAFHAMAVTTGKQWRGD